MASRTSDHSLVCSKIGDLVPLTLTINLHYLQIGCVVARHAYNVLNDVRPSMGGMSFGRARCAPLLASLFAVPGCAGGRSKPWGCVSYIPGLHCWMLNHQDANRVHDLYMD